MKYIYHTLLSVLICFVMGWLVSSCNYLDIVPDNVATLDNAFTDRVNTEKFLATCYSYLPNYGDPWVNPGLLGSDEVWFNEELGNPQATLIARNLQSIVTPYLNYWDGLERGKPLFQGIRDCNIFLENIDKPHDIQATERRRWIAEVKFLKAYYHFWLFKSYGPIPIIDENLPIYTSSDGIKTYREPVDDVVEYIVALIDEAMVDLPLRVQSLTTEMGRITKPIAASIKARLLATAASPLFNGNPDFAALVDNRGMNLFNPDYSLEKWERAADALKEAIEICEEAGHKLVEEYQTTSDLNETIRKELMLRSIISARESPEVIWGSTHFRFSQTYQRMAQPLLVTVTSANPVSQYYAATLRMAELFYSENGVPIEEDVSFPYDKRYELRRASSDEADFVEPGQQTAQLHFDREPRFYAGIAFDRGAYVLDPTYRYVQTRAGELATKRNQGEFSATGYFVKKLVDAKNNFSGQDYVINYSYPFPIIRLADLYLLYAEALNEIKTTPDEEVYHYVDLIRFRAGLDGVVESWKNHSRNPSKPSTQSGMREIIRQERMIELAFEGQRFWDIRRWKTAEDILSQPIQGWNINGPGLEFYQVVNIWQADFETKDYFWPIKETEIINNPNLVQNPGW
ncbi:MAG TPA: RagB/SusD family nutrient uptake outer membrane protein [Membranihabitans sp.]|nr:RagB/SusD family nutrient uptake outer membrane protein [Membranihabitans sp.]